jgi:hypothetical protein
MDEVGAEVAVFLVWGGVESGRNVKEGGMQRRMSAVLAASLLMSHGAFAKNKNGKALPDYILRAHTVAVMIDPNAGMSVDDPQANVVARKDVETALLNWGRFLPVVSAQGADLVIVIRKGHGRMADETISVPPQDNNRPAVVSPMDHGASVGAQHGTQQGPIGSGFPDASSARPQMEVGAVDDSFVVYAGDSKDPMDGPAGWRYTAKDGLRSHNVPAVEEFRKAVAEADKVAAAKNP